MPYWIHLAGKLQCIKRNCFQNKWYLRQRKRHVLSKRLNLETTCTVFAEQIRFRLPPFWEPCFLSDDAKNARWYWKKSRRAFVLFENFSRTALSPILWLRLMIIIINRSIATLDNNNLWPETQLLHPQWSSLTYTIGPEDCERSILISLMRYWQCTSIVFVPSCCHSNCKNYQVKETIKSFAEATF